MERLRQHHQQAAEEPTLKMATLLDIGLLKHISIVFPFLFVFVAVYAALEMVQVFGKEKRHLHAMLAFLLAVMTLFSPIVTETINLMAPWFVLVFIVSIFALVIYMLFGLKWETVQKQWTGPKGIKDSPLFYWMLALILIIAIGSFMTVTGEKKGFKTLTGKQNVSELQAQADTEVAQTGTAAFFATLTHPKVLGAMLLLLVGVFAIQHLTDID